MCEEIATPMSNQDLTGRIAEHLPYLRRYARALTGSQSAGDAHAAATLEAILADSRLIDPTLDPKVALFRVFHGIWSSAGQRVEAPGEEEGPLVAKAQDRLRALSTRERVALLLSSLEDFDRSAVAQIMDVDSQAAARLIEAGLQDLARQVAGRILIIEDEPVIAMDLDAIVRSLGHIVAGSAASRDEAVEAALAKTPNLILADIQLADGSSGIDAVNDILNTIAVPVIFITAYPERLLTGQGPEPTFLITKPFSEEQVRVAIGQALFFEGIRDDASDGRS